MVSLAAKALTPTLVAGCPDVKRYRGFTLLELLVVLAIVAVIIGLAAVRFEDSGARDTLASAEHLSIALESARDGSIYSGVPVAFSSDGVGYQFWRGDDKQHKWIALSENADLAAQKLKHDVQIVKQIVNGNERPLGERLVFQSDGLSEPFILLLQGGKSRVQIQADALGRISITTLADDINAQ
jgi:general secretion pathway protein H